MSTFAARIPITLTPTSLVALLSTLILAANGASSPQIDFDRMGKVAVAGSFAGLDLYNAQQPSASFDPSTSTILLRGADGGLTQVGSTNSGGVVSAVCALGDFVYFAGSFTSVSGQNANNIIAYKPSSSQFSALSGGGLDGPVDALYCDSSSNAVWVGGSFRGPSSSSSGYDGSVAVYTPSSNSWSPPGFGGLSGSVASIVSNADSSSLLFGGSFITSYQSNGGNLTAVDNPNVPQSTGSTPFTSRLVPFPLSSAEVTSGPSSNRAGLGDVTAILCPSGPDGPGSTYFAQEGSESYITIRDFTFLAARGIRLGNTFFDGQSTTAFSVTSIPDNQVLTLTYNTPGTDQTNTCSDSCPLSTDPSVAFQDFLFTGDDITGVQLDLKAWNGAGAGLHLLQLLSDGSFAPAIPSSASSSCYSPGPSTVQTTGTWAETQVFTSIAATTQTVLTSSVQVGSTTSPTLTWNVYTSASGQYDVYLLVPGCVNMQDCDARTSVDVTINLGGNMSPVTKTVSQQNNDDAQLLVYSGPIIPTAPDYTVSIKLALSANPTGTGSGGQYILVADRVNLQLTSASLSGNDTNGSVGSSATKQGFGVYEWPLHNSPSNVNATGVIPNNTETSITNAAFGLFSGMGNSTSAAAQASVESIVAITTDKVFIGGKFQLSGGISNIVASNSGSLAALANQGLNGAVSAMVQYGNALFVGGSFTSTSDGSLGLSYIAWYDIAGGRWSTLGGGLDGPVTSLGLSNGHLTVTGNFTHTLITSSTALGASGLASWDISGGRWSNSGGLLAGKMSTVANATTSNDNTEYLAGSVTMYLKYGADGAASLSNGNNGQAQITPLGAVLDGPVSTSTTAAKRSGWGLNILNLLAPRQQAVPADQNAPAPSVLSGVFWTNTTNSHQVMIIGGNFSIPGTSAVSLGIYDPNDESIAGLKGNQINGIIRSLLVVGSKLYVGGEFTLQGVNGQSFAVYDLSAQNWVPSVTGLTANSGQAVVRSITTVTDTSTTIIVAGSFASAGSAQCNGICSFDINSQAWSTLGYGVTGDVETVSYAGANANILLAGGSLTLSGSQVYLASYTANNQSWAAVGTLPGPITALEVDDNNQSSVFAAGKTSSGTFMSHWDGSQWTTVDLPLATTSNITQLEMVPIQEDHNGTPLVESNRVLWISGSLAGNNGNFTSVSAGLYDGQNFYPYLITSTSSGAAGSVSSFFHSFSTFSFNQRKFLAVGVVILISIALGAGIVFLLGLIGILWTLFARRDDRNFGQDTVVEDDDSARPSSLLAHINAATRNTILGTPGNDYYGHKGEETMIDDPNRPPSTAGSHIGAGAAAAAGAAGVAGAAAAADKNTLTPVTTSEENDVNRPARARYSFDGKEEGELPLHHGQEVTILNDRDSAWWYVRDNTTQREGIVPSSYLV